MFMCPAVHTMTHSLLRSSSTHEPSDPPLRVLYIGLLILSYMFLLKEIKNTPFYWHISIPSINLFLYLKRMLRNVLVSYNQ